MAGLDQGFNALVDVAHETIEALALIASLPRLKEPDAMWSFMICTPSWSLGLMPATSSKATVSHRPTRPTLRARSCCRRVGDGRLPARHQDAVRADPL